MRHFSPRETVVYPAHGVGTIRAVRNLTVEGIPQEMYVIDLTQGGVTLHVPLENNALRPLVTKKEMEVALKKLTGNRKRLRGYPHHIKRAYEQKLASGDITLLTELVRDTYVSEGQVQSYSLQQIAEKALTRLVDELAAVTGRSESVVYALVEEALATKGYPKN